MSKILSSQAYAAAGRKTLELGRQTRLHGNICTLGLLLFSTAQWAHAQEEVPPEDRVELEEIIVTGTSIRGASQPTGSQLVTVGRTQIEQSSAANTADLLADVPVLNSFNTAPRVSDVGASGATPPGLRGLPAAATLILLNGHRLVGDSPLSTFPDPTSIPPSAIERIEIVPDGSSAIYGSDAVAGVINIITRKDFDGAEITARYGFADGHDAFDVNGVVGQKWNTGSATFAAGYSGNDHLQNRGRDFFIVDKTAFGGQDFRDLNCFPSNVVVAGTSYAPPDYAPGAARCANEADADILSDNRRVSVLGSVQQELGERLDIFIDAKYSETRSIQNRPFPATTFDVSNTNPFFRAPPGTGATSATVQYSLAGILPSNPQNRFESEAGGVTFGADWDIDGNWLLSFTGTHGWSTTTALNPGFNADLLAAAVNGTTTATALDPFGSGTSASVVAGIADFALLFSADQALYDAVAKLDGALWELPGGELKIALGGAFRREEYDAVNPVGPSGNTDPVPSASAERDSESAFAEILVPVIGEQMNLPLARRIQLSAAVRYDNYDDFGSTTNPKYGATWEVLRGLVLRGSYGTSFHAPSLADTQSVDTRALFFPNFPLSVSFQPLNTIALAGGNPDLKPERGTTYSAGIDFAPVAAPGLSISTTYYQVAYKDQVRSLIEFFPFPFFTDPNLIALGIISNPTAQQVADLVCCMRLQGFPATLPAIGQILDFRRTNVSASEVQGIDFNVRYDWNTAIGAFNTGLSGIRVLSYDFQASPGAPEVDNLRNGVGEIPWRVRADIGWNKGALRLDAALSYTGAYRQSFTTTAGDPALQQVDSYIIADLHASYDLPFGGAVSNTTLLLNLDNVLDEDPPFVLSRFTGFDSGKTNPIGRTIWVGVKVDF